MTFTLAVSSETVFTDLPHVERVRRLHALGFAVEIWGWTDKDADALAATGARFTSMTGYSSGDLTTPGGSTELLSSAERAIGFAKRLNQAGALPALNLHGTGLGEDGLPIRPVERTTPQMRVAARDTLHKVAALGRAHGVTFVLENLNTDVDHPGVPFARAADTLRLVQAVASPNLRLNLDLYHAQIGEGNLSQLITKALPYIGEVQIADVPGRCEPGTGEIRWRYIASRLADAGYDGVVALEAFASDPTADGSVAAVEAFRSAFTI